MRVCLENATAADAAAIAALRLAVARESTAQYGRGPWSFTAESEAGVRADLLSARVMIAREAGAVVATLRLSSRSPYLQAFDFFPLDVTALYLTSMAVAPKRQRSGLGRACLEEVKRIAVAWPVGVVRLDAYDAPAGAGGFYRKCGFTEVARTPYNGTPLIFFEWSAVTRPPVEKLRHVYE
jgi:GNAT superfamily N-acetyltransferase